MVVANSELRLRTRDGVAATGIETDGQAPYEYAGAFWDVALGLGNNGYKDKP